MSENLNSELQDSDVKKEESQRVDGEYSYSFCKTNNRSKEPEECAHRYGDYKVNQNMEKHEESGIRSNKKAVSAGRKRKKSGIRRVVQAACLGLVFGLSAGLTFTAVMKLSGAGEQPEQPVETAAVKEYQKDMSHVSEDKNEEHAQNLSVAEVASVGMPSVVAITSVSIQEIPSFFGYGFGYREYPSTGSGSGIIVGENEQELLIATNNHVVEGADTLSVCFVGNDVENAEQETRDYASGLAEGGMLDAVSAQIMGTDRTNDLAVVSVAKADIPEETLQQLKIVKIGSSDDLVVGEQVVAIGNALGYGQSLTSGYISAKNRTLTASDGVMNNLLQTDAAINPGNSGGPLLNMKGELIGINCAKSNANAVEGMGYAIPISGAQPILEQLMKVNGRSEKVDSDKAGYLGIKIMDLEKETIHMYNIPDGAFVSEVTPGTPAEEAGILPKDVITYLDGKKISGKKDLIDRLSYYMAGEEVTITVVRAEYRNWYYDELDFRIVLGSRQTENS